MGYENQPIEDEGLDSATRTTWNPDLCFPGLPLLPANVSSVLQLARVLGITSASIAPHRLSSWRSRSRLLPTRPATKCSSVARPECQSLPHWCAYALREHDQGNNWFRQTDLDWCRAALRVRADRLDGFCLPVIIP